MRCFPVATPPQKSNLSSYNGGTLNFHQKIERAFL
jgi:hypothetical protein